MKKILVVFTGGTIASKVSHQTIDVREDTGYLLIQEFQKKSELDVTFQMQQPFTILSENSMPVHWTRLIKCLQEADLSQYDGVIITHGSDTLPYTAAAISYAFRHSSIPIVLTASNYALSEPKSNGLNNFIHAVEFICLSKMRGIYVLFENEMGIPVIYLGTRIQEADSVRDQYSTIGGVDFGFWKDKHFHKGKSVEESLLSQLATPQKEIPFCLTECDNSVLALHTYPGLNYSMLMPFQQKRPCAVLHELYHSSTACIQQGQQSLAEFVQYCKKENIDSYLLSFKKSQINLYATTKELLEQGAIPLQSISREAAIVKLWFAYNAGVDCPEKFMNESTYYEFV